MSSQYLTQLKTRRDRVLSELKKKREELDENSKYYERDDDIICYEIRELEVEYLNAKDEWFAVFDEVFCRKCDVLSIENIADLVDLRIKLFKSFE